MNANSTSESIEISNKSLFATTANNSQNMSLVVQLGTAVCNNNIISTQQSSPLAATAVTSPDLAVTAHNSSGLVELNNSQSSTPLVVTSQFQTIYKKSTSNATAILQPSSTINKHSAFSDSSLVVPVNSASQTRVHNVNVQRGAIQLSHISPQSKIQVLSNVIVPKSTTNYVINKSINQRSSPNCVTSTSSSLHRTISTIPIKSSNYITASTVQSVSTSQMRDNTTQKKVAGTAGTHVISRVITSNKTLQQSKAPSMVVQQQRVQSSANIKILPPQVSPTQFNQKSNVSRIQNIVQQQRTTSGIKTIPPQRPTSTTYSTTKTVMKNVKPNNFIVKNSSLIPSRQNLLSTPKGSKPVVVQNNHQTSPVRNVQSNQQQVVKYQGQQYQVISATPNNQQPSVSPLQSVTVVRTVASYEDNNVPTNIATTLFSTSSAPNIDNINHSTDDTYLSEDDVISEERPDYSKYTNPVLFDHNYHLPPPDSPPPQSPTKLSTTLPLDNTTIIDSANITTNNSTNQISPNYIYNNKVNNNRLNSTYTAELNQMQEDDVGSTISSDAGREVEPEGEETETAPEGEGEDDSITRCICDFEHDDGYMICCDKCSVWQHVDCMFFDRQTIQEEYLCERCEPRRVDKQRARSIQLRKREEILNNGSSSDTSSGSSLIDNSVVPINNNIANKKRSIQTTGVNHQLVGSGTGRRKNDQRNRSLSSTQRRSRRDLNSSVQRKNVVKRRQERKVQSKRKTKTRRNQEKTDENNEYWDSKSRENSTNSMLQLRQWIEHYEEAVTNHYSPELRARILKQNSGQNTDMLVQANTNVHKCRVSNQINTGTKMLVASVFLAANTPIIELRGKYMLGSPQQPNAPNNSLTGRHHHRPGPFLFFYKLSKDGVDVCVDTRTYGNDARFVRRSCKPNSEVRHCIEKGTLHLYLVSLNPIEKNAEITIKHETYSLTGSNLITSCACGNPLQCTFTQNINLPVKNSATNNNGSSSSTMVTRRSNGHVHDLVELNTQRKRRGRRTISSSEQVQIDISNNRSTSPQAIAKTPTPSNLPQFSPTSPPIPDIAVAQTNSVLTTVASPLPSPTPNINTVTLTSGSTSTTPGPVRRSSQSSVRNTPIKVDDKSAEQLINTTSVIGNVEKNEEPEMKDKKKMTREERKMEAIMKAFERLEKQEQRKQESKTRQAHRRESDTGQSEQNLHQDLPKSKRKKRKGRARTTSINSLTVNQTGRRRVRVNSTDSYMTSGDDSSLTSPPLPSNDMESFHNISITNTQSKTNENYDQSENTVDNDHKDDEIKNESMNECSPQQSNPMSTEGHAAGLLLALANGVQHNDDHLKSPIRDPDTCSSAGSLQSSPGTPLSSNCLLVAAAVEQITPGFKLPKTKKVIMNEWLNKSPETVTSNNLITSLQPQMNRPLDLPTSLNHQIDSHLSSRQSLSTLVQAANICSVTSANAQHNTVVGSAKKRWLRQAISEECDSPNSRPESPHANEMIAPPKKRRLARESVSSEQSFTPPTTPTHPNHINNVNDDFDTDNISNNFDEYYTEEKMINEFNDDAKFNENSKQKDNYVTHENGYISQDNDQKDENKNYNDHSDLSTFNDKSKEHRNNAPSNLDPRLRYESAHCLGKVEETLQMLESWTSCTPKMESITPAKRKLSISEYRQRKQQFGNTNKNSSIEMKDKLFEEMETSPTASNTTITQNKIYNQIDSPKAAGRVRTNSSSSTTSSLSSDDEQKETLVLSLDIPEKKAPAFNSEPTLVELQRENLTARLKREFGLFVPEEDENKKLTGVTQSTTVVTKSSPSPPAVMDTVAQTNEEHSSPNVQQPPPPPTSLLSNNENNIEPIIKTDTINTKFISSHQNGAYKNVPPVNFITPFDNPVYPNTTYYRGFPSGKNYLNDTIVSTQSDASPILKSSNMFRKYK